MKYRKFIPIMIQNFTFLCVGIRPFNPLCIAPISSIGGCFDRAKLPAPTLRNFEILNHYRYKQEKLWRDKAVDRLEQMGSKIHWERLEGERFEEELKVKLLEEAEEGCNAMTREERLEELADLLEVVSSFCEFHDVSFDEIQRIQEGKRHERGGVQGRKYVTVAEHLEGSFGAQYCLNDQDKYPEIFD